MFHIWQMRNIRTITKIPGKLSTATGTSAVKNVESWMQAILKVKLTLKEAPTCTE